LLLGEHAKGSSIPELDVKIDDVTCGHAASSSSLTPASLRYLTGRGLDEKTASDLLVHGFLDQGVSILSESEGSDSQA
jgi:Fe-S cluster assembly protein SufD